MVIAHHIIFGMYGFWLPNDPRGSWSDFVGAWELYRYGRATKTASTHSLARRSHDAALRLAAKKALRRSPAQLTGVQARSVARGFALRRARETAGLRMRHPSRSCASGPEPSSAERRTARHQTEGLGDGAIAGRRAAPVRRSRRAGPHAEVLCPRPVGRISRFDGRRSSGDSLCRGESAQGREAAAKVVVCKRLLAEADSRSAS